MASLPEVPLNLEVGVCRLYTYRMNGGWLNRSLERREPPINLCLWEVSLILLQLLERDTPLTFASICKSSGSLHIQHRQEWRIESP